MAPCKNSVLSDLTRLYLCNKTTLEQLACLSWHSQQQLSVNYAQNVAQPCSCGDQVVTDRQTHICTHTKTGRLLTVTLCLRAWINNHNNCNELMIFAKGC